MHTIINKTVFTLVTVSSILFVAFAPSVPASAIDVLPACDNPDNSEAANEVCSGQGDSVYKLLRNVINLMLTFIGIIAVIAIIIGAIRYTTSGGDGSQTKGARDTILYAVVGLVVAVLSFALVNFVLRGVA